MSEHTLESMLQTVYNLNWKNRAPGSGRKEWVYFNVDGTKIVIFPTALEYTAPHKPTVKAVNWEVHYDNNEKLININLRDESLRKDIEQLLHGYLGFRELTGVWSTDPSDLVNGDD